MPDGLGETPKQRANRLDDQAWNATIVATVLAQTASELEEWPEAAAIDDRNADLWRSRASRFEVEAAKWSAVVAGSPVPEPDGEGTT